MAAEATAIVQQVASIFPIRALVELENLTGLEIACDREADTVSICQVGKVLELADAFSIAGQGKCPGGLVIWNSSDLYPANCAQQGHKCGNVTNAVQAQVTERLVKNQSGGGQSACTGTPHALGLVMSCPGRQPQLQGMSVQQVIRCIARSGQLTMTTIDRFVADASGALI
jgi:hypothetical protein